MQLERRYRVFLAIAAVTLAADQLSKYWARNALPRDAHDRGIAVSVIENFWDWRLSWNTGSAFGLFSSVGGARIFLTVVGLAALVAIVWMLRKSQPEQGRLHWAFGLVGGGAVGNIVDRIYFGKVTDFVVWRYHEHAWPTFNVADVALCIGVGLLFLDLGRDAQEGDGDGQRAKRDEKPPRSRTGAARKRKKRGGSRRR